MPFTLQHLLKFQDMTFLMWDDAQDPFAQANMYGNSQWLVDTNQFLDVQTFAATFGHLRKLEEFVDSVFWWGNGDWITEVKMEASNCTHCKLKYATLFLLDFTKTLSLQNQKLLWYSAHDPFFFFICFIALCLSIPWNE